MRDGTPNSRRQTSASAATLERIVQWMSLQMAHRDIFVHCGIRSLSGRSGSRGRLSVVAHWNYTTVEVGASTHPGKIDLLSLVQRLVELCQRGANGGCRLTHGQKTCAHQGHAGRGRERRIGGGRDRLRGGGR